MFSRNSVCYEVCSRSLGIHTSPVVTTSPQQPTSTKTFHTFSYVSDRLANFTGRFNITRIRTGRLNWQMLQNLSKNVSTPWHSPRTQRRTTQDQLLQKTATYKRPIYLLVVGFFAAVLHLVDCGEKKTVWKNNIKIWNRKGRTSLFFAKLRWRARRVITGSRKRLAFGTL